MTDDPFETRLDRLFTLPPEDAGDDAFHQALLARMRHSLRLRRAAFVGAALAGCAVAAFEAWMSAPLLGGAADTASRLLMAAHLGGRDLADTLWIAVGLVAVAGYGISQAVRGR